MGGNSIEKVVWLNVVIFSGAVFLNAAVMDIKMLEYPEATKKLMVGKRLQLEWKFSVGSTATKQWNISLYIFNFTLNSKLKIAKMRETGRIDVNPFIPPKLFQRLDYKLSPEGYAKLWVSDTIFQDSAGYGISLKSSNIASDKEFEKVTEVLVVDMFLNKESSGFLETWFGKPIQLVCSIILKRGADSPTFIWFNKLKNVTITENIIVTMTKSVLTIIPAGDDDFGSYICRVTTMHTKIKHNITLVKIEYPGYPILIHFSASNRSLSWNAPTSDKDGLMVSFLLQYLQDKERCKWVNVHKTTNLAIAMSSLSIFLTGDVTQPCSVRVCSTSRKSSENSSCSQTLKLRSEYSPAPIVYLKNDSTGKVTLFWRRQTWDKAPIFGYVIQIIKESKTRKNDALMYIHLDYKENKEQYTFTNLKKVKDAFFRVCMRNSLCIYEGSCSDKVGVYSANPGSLSEKNEAKPSQTALASLPEKNEAKPSQTPLVSLPEKKDEAKPSQTALVYPSEPRSIRFDFQKGSSKVIITWKEPSMKGKGSINYIVEVQKSRSGQWKAFKFTQNLYASLNSLTLSDHIRVCAKKNGGGNNPSCSKGFDLSKEKLKTMNVGFGGAGCRATIYTWIMMINATLFWLIWL